MAPPAQSQHIPEGFELIADFSLPADPSTKTCEYPGTCKNPDGRTILPGQPSFPTKSAQSNIPHILCQFCKAHVDQKPGTQLRRISVQTSSMGSPTRPQGFFFVNNMLGYTKTLYYQSLSTGLIQWQSERPPVPVNEVVCPFCLSLCFLCGLCTVLIGPSICQIF